VNGWPALIELEGSWLSKRVQIHLCIESGISNDWRLFQVIIQWSGRVRPVSALVINCCTVFEQELYSVKLPTTAGPMEWCPFVPCHIINQRFFIEQ